MLPAPPKALATSDLSGIKNELGKLNTKVSGIDTRLREVERDLEDRPTRAEFHQMDKILARYDERLNGIEKTTKATNHGVQRLEEFMIQASAKGDR